MFSSLRTLAPGVLYAHPRMPARGNTPGCQRGGTYGRDRSWRARRCPSAPHGGLTGSVGWQGQRCFVFLASCPSIAPAGSASHHCVPAPEHQRGGGICLWYSMPCPALPSRGLDQPTEVIEGQWNMHPPRLLRGNGINAPSPTGWQRGNNRLWRGRRVQRCPSASRGLDQLSGKRGLM